MTDLVRAIESTAAGELLCSPRMAADLLHRAAQKMKQQTEQIAGRSFTAREQEVLSLLKQGRSNKEIASRPHFAQADLCFEPKLGRRQGAMIRSSNHAGNPMYSKARPARSSHRRASIARAGRRSSTARVPTSIPARSNAAQSTTPIAHAAHHRPKVVRYAARPNV